MTRRLPWNERRQSIVDAASSLFATRGYEHTTIDEIASRAGVTKPIVYRHFGSKKQLHLALLALHRDALLETLAMALQEPGSLADRVRSAAEAWLGYVQDHRYASEMLFRDTTGDREIQAFHEEMRATARSAVAALIAAEPNSAVPDHLLEPLAELVRAALTGLATWWAQQTDVPHSDMVEVTVNGIWSGLERARLPGAWV